MDVESILGAIAPPPGQAPPNEDAENTKRISRFLGKTLISPEVDFHSSLILLQAGNGWHIRGNLHATPMLSELPQIERTGPIAPFMYGHLLGFDDDAIVDPDLQRARCLSFCNDAAFQEWIYLLLRIFGALDQQVEPATLQKLCQWHPAVFAPLREVIEAARDLFTQPVDSGQKEQRVNHLIDAVGNLIKHSADVERIPGKWRTHLLSRILELLQKVPAKPKPEEGLCLKLWATLLLSYQWHEWRHLGTRRGQMITRDEHCENIVVQGVGDLSMNQWNVAFSSDRFCADGNVPGESEVVIPFQEPSASRNYNCLLVWKSEDTPNPKLTEALRSISRDRNGIALQRDVAIAEVRISKIEPKLRLASHPTLALDDITRFAFYGKQVLREGEVIRGTDVVDEFQDLRHVFDLPNLNPADDAMEAFLKRRVCPRLGPLAGREDPSRESGPKFFEALEGIFGDPGLKVGPAETPDPAADFLLERRRLLRTMLRRPRILFNQFQDADVWLLEAALLEISNLKHLACNSTIAVGLRELGCPMDWVEFRLLSSRYVKRDRRTNINHPGEFAWDLTKKGNPILYVSLRAANYPCTMIGIGSPSGTEDYDTLYLLAWGHDFQYASHSVWDCAQVLRAAGAKYALVVDEGQDVFQCHVPDGLVLRSTFSERERNCESLEEYMRVPIAHSPRLPDGVTMLRRTGLRASVAFWQGYHA